MLDDRTREYAEWYVWAKRNLTSTPEICHAAAQAATEAKAAGRDPQVAARDAGTSRGGPGWTQPADAEQDRDPDRDLDAPTGGRWSEGRGVGCRAGVGRAIAGGVDGRLRGWRRQGRTRVRRSSRRVRR